MFFSKHRTEKLMTKGAETRYKPKHRATET